MGCPVGAYLLDELDGPHLQVHPDLAGIMQQGAVHSLALIEVGTEVVVSHGVLAAGTHAFQVRVV